MSRNPFGVTDAPDPDGEDVIAFAERVEMTETVDDKNAERWYESSADAPMSIEGEWSSRWKADGIDWQIGRGILSRVGQRI